MRRCHQVTSGNLVPELSVWDLSGQCWLMSKIKDSSDSCIMLRELTEKYSEVLRSTETLNSITNIMRCADKYPRNCLGCYEIISLSFVLLVLFVQDSDIKTTCVLIISLSCTVYLLLPVAFPFPRHKSVCFPKVYQIFRPCFAFPEALCLAVRVQVEPGDIWRLMTQRKSQRHDV